MPLRSVVEKARSYLDRVEEDGREFLLIMEDGPDSSTVSVCGRASGTFQLNVIGWLYLGVISGLPVGQWEECKALVNRILEKAIKQARGEANNVG